MAELSVVVLALLGLGVAAAGWLANRLGLPPSLGYLAVGIGISPALAGRLGIPFEAITEAAHVAVLLLLFFIGLELDLKKLQEIVSKTAGTTLFNIVVPAILAASVAVLAGWTLPQAFALGIAVSISSTIFGERLSVMEGFGKESRRRVLGILLGEDVGAAALLAILVLLGGTAEGGWFAPVYATSRLLFLLILMAAGALLVVPRIMDAVARTRVPELLVLVGGALVLGFGALGSWAGSPELGALVAGVAAAEAGARFTIRNQMAPLRDLALAVFFVGSGMAVDAGLVAVDFPLAILVASVFLASKILVNVPASLAAGQPLPDAMRTALGLGTLGEFSLILVASAEANGIAHPSLRAVVVGAMVITLAAAPMLVQATPWLVRLAQKAPPRSRRAIQWLIQTQRNRRGRTPVATKARRSAAFLLAANVILLVAWGLIAAWAGQWVVQRVRTPSGLLVPMLVFGVAVAVAAPLVFRAYRAYRDLVWLLVGLGAGEPRDTAGRIRARLVDGWVVATVALLLVPVSLVVPSTLPVLVGGLLVAVGIVAVAWRQLSGFQQTLEASVTRVLGHDPRAAAMLDHVLGKYPWGVRFAAGTVAPDSPVAGMTLAQGRIHELSGALVAVHQSRGQETVNPGPDTRLLPGDTVILMGEAEELAKAEALLVAHGEALRASVQSRLAAVVELPIAEDSPLVGRALGEAGLRAATGALVVGLWPHGEQHPLPFRPDLILRKDDRLILLGAPLQVERARRLASPPPPPAEDGADAPPAQPS